MNNEAYSLKLQILRQFQDNFFQHPPQPAFITPSIHACSVVTSL